MRERLALVVAVALAASAAAAAPAMRIGSRGATAAPFDATPPTISGTPAVGRTLTAAGGAWLGRSVRISYQWLRCDPSGAGCRTISGARSKNRVPTAADVGSTQRVAVAGTNRYGTSTATSSATAVVAAAPTPPPTAPSLPTAPGNLQTTTATTTTIAVVWSASTAAAGLGGYDLYENGAAAGTTTATAAVFTGIACGTTASLAVDAYDALGNHSARVMVSGSTTACAPPPPPATPPPDTQPPTTPGNLHATGTTASSIAVAWDASTDDTRVSGYGVYENGTVVSTPTSASATLTGLTCGTAYTIAVAATDAAGNQSAKASLSVTTAACAAPAPPPAQAAGGALTGAHWGTASDLSTFKQLGYGFDVTTVDPNDPSSWPGILDAAQANGLKLIIGGYPEPYSYSNGQWSISAAGVNLLNYLASRSSLILALFVYNEPYWSNPVNGATSSCGELSAADLRGLRTKIQSVWPGAKIYQDLGQPSQWAPGGSLAQSYSCIGNKYADQTGVADYVGIWDYPFEAGGYQKARALSTLTRESNYVINSMHAIPVWLNQSHAASCCNLVFPTKAQILDWNCAVRAALPPSGLISWYVWRQDSYSDVLANHPEDWASTTAAACS